MKILIVNLYKLVYRITGDNKASIIITLIYITILNLTVTYGISILASGVLPVKILQKFFAFPYIILTAVIMFLIDLWIMSPLKYIRAERKNKFTNWGIIMYTSIAILVFIYSRYGSRLF